MTRGSLPDGHTIASTRRRTRPTPTVARITFANPPANLLTPPTIDGLRTIIMDLEQDVSQDVKRGIAALPTSIKTRILF